MIFTRIRNISRKFEYIKKIVEKTREQDNEVMATNFDSDSDDAHSSNEEEDNDDEEMYRSISIFTPVKTFYLYPFCSLLFLAQFFLITFRYR